ASGYRKLELVRHYMALPIVVTLLASIIGNILGYTSLKKYMANLYYNSYSLVKSETLWHKEAFIHTTVIPVILMFVINFLVLSKKLNLPPIRFLRHDLTKKGKKKAFPLSDKIPFMKRFRLRVILQNLPNYLTLLIGLFLGGNIIIFSLMFVPMLDDFRDMILDTRLSNYQYILKETQAEVADKRGERFLLASLKTDASGYVEDEVTLYGIEENSDYINIEPNQGQVFISAAYSQKYKLKPGDTITLKDPFVTRSYSYKVQGIYDYYSGIAVFMDKDTFQDSLKDKTDYAEGLFSNTRLKLKEEEVAKQITVDDLTMLSDQLEDSMGNFMYLLRFFGIVMFLLLMYLLSKQIIEKNSNAISMAKILGFKNKEIGSIYIAATSIVVVLSLIIICPFTHMVLKVLFTEYIYTKMTGYIPFIIGNDAYLLTILMGIACYALIALVQMGKIKRISKVDVLKNLE
ncbi:MAG TPA: ABC transporter permease, partial [Clostridiaceae bacterium]|nr:ABC transporter permease [Clostridiaceae bacterium]